MGFTPGESARGTKLQGMFGLTWPPGAEQGLPRPWETPDWPWVVRAGHSPIRALTFFFCSSLE